MKDAKSAVATVRDPAVTELTRRLKAKELGDAPRSPRSPTPLGTATPRKRTWACRRSINRRQQAGPRHRRQSADNDCRPDRRHGPDQSRPISGQSARSKAPAGCRHERRRAGRPAGNKESIARHARPGRVPKPRRRCAAARLKRVSSDRITRVPNHQPRRIVVRRVGDVEVVPHATNRGIGIISGEERIFKFSRRGGLGVVRPGRGRVRLTCGQAQTRRQNARRHRGRVTKQLPTRGAGAISI